MAPIFIPLTLNAVDRADTVDKVLEIRSIFRCKLRPEFTPLTGGSWALFATSLLLLLAAGSAVFRQDLILLLFD